MNELLSRFGGWGYIGGLVFSGALIFQSTHAAVEIHPGQDLLQEKSAPGKLNVGDRVRRFAFEDLEGNPYQIRGKGESEWTVYVFLSTECPVAKRYTQRLKRLRNAYADNAVRFIAVHPNFHETKDQIRAHHREIRLGFPVVQDGHGRLTRLLGATMTPQVFVLDASGILKYRGAIDDNDTSTRVKHRYLESALDALIAGILSFPRIWTGMFTWRRSMSGPAIWRRFIT